MTVKDLNTGNMISNIEFEDATGMFNSTANPKVTGVIMDQAGKTVYNLTGDWLKGTLDATDVKTGEVTNLYTRKPGPENQREQFNFPKFSINANHIYEDLVPELCPTDSRFRGDQRALENGDKDLSEKEKSRLENL